MSCFNITPLWFHFRFLRNRTFDLSKTLCNRVVNAQLQCFIIEVLKYSTLKIFHNLFQAKKFLREFTQSVSLRISFADKSLSSLMQDYSQSRYFALLIEQEWNVTQESTIRLRFDCVQQWNRNTIRQCLITFHWFDCDFHSNLFH